MKAKYSFTLYLLGLLLLPCENLFSQGRDNLWMMGYSSYAGLPYGGTNIDFNSGMPSVYYVNRPQNIVATNANITDSLGQLLFCSNGDYIADASGDTMLNGSGLNPSTYTNNYHFSGLFISQADIIIPIPNSSNGYYLFHQTVDTTYNDGHSVTLKLYYSVIDMSLNGGLGAVGNKNVELFLGNLIPGRLTAVKHGNGRDWWLLCHHYNSNKYSEFLITPSGIQGPFNFNVGASHLEAAGQIAFSKDGNILAWYDVGTDLDILNFDRCSGVLTNRAHITINDSAACGGVAFSPSGQYLYVSSYNYVYQFDMNSANISSSQVTVAAWDSSYLPHPPFATVFYLAQLAPDNKIYINNPNSTTALHVINNPDSLGMACDVCQNCILLPTFNAYSFPNHPNYHLAALSGSLCDTLLSTNELSEISYSAFPNPVQDKLTINFNQSLSIQKIEVVDVLGQIVFSQKQNSSFQNSITVPLEDLKHGIYFCKISSGEGVVTIKVLKE